jgi:hypothetical protein
MNCVKQAYEAKNLDNIQEGLATAKKLKDRTITATFQRQGKGKHTFMTHQYTFQEIW